jgi:hypothetical protein
MPGWPGAHEGQNTFVSPKFDSEDIEWDKTYRTNTCKSLNDQTYEILNTYSIE